MSGDGAPAAGAGNRGQGEGSKAGSTAPEVRALPQTPVEEEAALMVATRRRVPLYLGIWRSDAPGSEAGCTHEVLMSGVTTADADGCRNLVLVSCLYFCPSVH